jgi:hypothetical protein
MITINEYFEEIKENFKYVPLTDIECEFLIDAVQSFLDNEGYWPMHEIGKKFEEGSYDE